MFARSIVLASAAAFVAGQSLSSACTSALTGLVANPDASSCLNPSALISLAGANDTSIIPPINNWLTGLCSAPACSNDTLTAVVQNITTGCSTELKAFGAGGVTSDQILPYVLQGYPTVRQLACLKDGSDLCIPKTLTTLEGAFGTLSITNIVKLATGDAAGSSNISIPDTVTCSNCAKAAYNVVKGAYPDLVSDLGTEASNKCGATFVDGNTPSGITLSATTSAATKPGNAAASNVAGFAGVAAAVFAALSGGVIVLV